MVNLSLEGVMPEYEGTGFEFHRIEMMEDEGSPLALVWYTTLGQHPRKELAARIDLQKQVFLDDFGNIDRAKFDLAARQIVLFVHGHDRPARLRQAHQ